MKYVSNDDNYDRLMEAYDKILQNKSLTSTYLKDDQLRQLYIKNSAELESFDFDYFLVSKEEYYSGNPKTRLEEQEKREAILKTDVEELTPLIEDLGQSRVNNLDEETLVRNRDMLLKRVTENRSTFSIGITIDIDQVRKQNLQLPNEDIDNWTESDLQYLLAQIVEIEKLPRNTKVSFGFRYKGKSPLDGFRFLSFVKQ